MLQKSSLKRVLLVDDSKMVLTIHASMLAEAGFECELASSGAEALEKLLTQKFDLLVTDLNMPRMDGYELTRKVRAASLPVPVIMISTEKDEADRRRGFEAGVDLYLTKPVTAEALVAQCHVLTGERKVG